MKHRFFYTMLRTFFLAVFLTAVSPGSPFAAESIKIGVAGAHSGDLASYGLPTVKAAEPVVNAVNAKGGVLGKQVAILVEDDTFIKVAQKYAEGVYATGPKDTTKNPLAVASIEAHKKAYGADPGAFFLNGIAATQSILNAIEKAGSTNYDALGKALQTQFVETPLGKIKFDKRGDAIGVGFSVYQVRKGVYVEVK